MVAEENSENAESDFEPKSSEPRNGLRILFFANTDWYLYNFRLGFAEYLRDVHHHEVIMLSPPGPFGPKFEALGFRWIQVQMNRRSLNPIESFRTLVRLRKIYSYLKPDIAHHFTIKSAVYGAIVSRVTKVPFSVHAITGLGSIFASSRRRILRPLVYFLMRVSMARSRMHVIVQNPDDFEMLRGIMGPQIETLSLIRGSGVDVARFTMSERPPDTISPAFLFVGRLIEEKGIREFYQASKILRKSLPGVRVLVAGTIDPGNPGSLAQAEVESWMDEGFVQFLGHVVDMPSLLQTVNVVVLPTTYGEGVPRSLIEAAASGLPIIATNSPGCREVLEHNVNGLFIEPKNVSQLAESMLLLANDPELRSKMGVAGRFKVETEFSAQQVFERTYSIYKHAFAKSY